MSLLAIYLLHRVEELTSDCLKLKKLNDALQIDLAKQVEQNETFKMVIICHCFFLSLLIVFLFTSLPILRFLKVHNIGSQKLCCSTDFIVLYYFLHYANLLSLLT